MAEIAQSIQTMELKGFLVFLLVFAIFAVIAFVIAYRQFRAYRIVIDTPTSRVRSAPQGYVEIKGHFQRINEQDPVRAPFSGKPCVWYHAKIEEKRGDDEDESWETIFSELDPRPCLLSDATGACLVLPAQADMRVAFVEDTYYEDGLFNDPPEPLKHVDTGLFDGPMRFTEERIEPGKGYVVGRFMTVDADDLTRRDANTAVAAVRELLSRWRDDYMGAVQGRPDQTRPNDIGSPEALSDEQKAALPVASIQWARERTGRDDIDSIITPTNEPRRPFIVGLGEEAKVAKRLRRIALAAALGFLVMGSAFGFFMLARYGVIGG